MVMMEITAGEIEKRFTYHPPKDNQPEKYERLRKAAKDLAYLIAEVCPESKEAHLALTSLQETVMWANASIACRE